MTEGEGSQIERFFKKDADSLYRMTKSYLRLENSPLEFVNSNDMSCFFVPRCP